jgi:nicotinamide-nucleotide amidase
MLAAFRLSAERPGAVIVSGGWARRSMISHRRSRHSPRNRVVSSNDKKQGMLPTAAEILDNPIGTACGFALDIAKAGFFLITRLLARGGSP